MGAEEMGAGEGKRRQQKPERANAGPGGLQGAGRLLASTSGTKQPASVRGNE